MQKMKIYLLLFFTCVLLTEKGFCQEQNNPISTAVPFLLISPDARSGGMGDNGVSTTPDVYSMYWNPAKYAFEDKQFGVGIGYVPWLRGLVNDIGLSSIAAFWKFGDKQAVAASLRFFSMGSVTFTNDIGQELGDVKPNEWTIDATYARKFSREFSGAVAGRFIYSNLVPVQLGNNLENVRPGTSVAADIALYYHHEMTIAGLTSAYINFGLDISDIGVKISYSSVSNIRDFIPTNLRLGPSFTMDIDEYNRLSLSLDLNKLLVPTPPIKVKRWSTADIECKAEDPEGDPVTYKWGATGGKIEGEGPHVVYIATTSGDFGVTVTVTDSKGAQTKMAAFFHVPCCGQG